MVANEANKLLALENLIRKLQEFLINKEREGRHCRTANSKSSFDKELR